MKTNLRRLKISYGYHGPPYVKHPVLRIAGKYLEKMGFNIGDEVEINIGAGRITIDKCNQGQIIPSKTEVGSAGAQPTEG